MHRHHLSSQSSVAAALLSFGLLLGCTGIMGSGDGPGQNGSGGGAGATGAAGSGTAGYVPDPTCSGTDLPAAKRIVRLSFNQVANSIGALIDANLGTKLVGDFELVDAEHRAFPPLQSPREGNSLTDQSWSTIDQIAQAAGKYVFDNFATISSCGATPTDACAQQYLTGFAQKAYRRPLTAAEQARITALYSTALEADAGATVSEAAQYVVYALMQSPQFLYRTEFGSDWHQDGGLTAYEVASMLSYFLTDNVPDQALLDAAAQNKLSSVADVGPHVDRILKTDAAKKNLEGALVSYFSYPNLENQVIQDPAFTGEMRQSMYHEAELFLQSSLWGPPLSELLISRKGFINATLAPIYGIAQFPPAGATLDAQQFAQIELPANRTGLLTQAGFLANRSRPNGTSVVGRGLLVKNALLCTETPPPPASVADAINQINAANPNASQRELSNIRGMTTPCNGCHATFDAYGLALDTFDVLGRFRMQDPEGRPIDPSVNLPEQVGGGTAKDIVEVAQKLASNGAFAKCMGKNLVNYGLADVSAGAAVIDSCAVSRIADAFKTTDQSFPALVKAVATSAAFTNRSKGSEGALP
jgi:Protein of unknown function (DUF1592)/Protein of unknown function (DUF1588)/Protein of unknown function (DUF1595)/Protein of unknown function (DUF1585)